MKRLLAFGALLLALTAASAAQSSTARQWLDAKFLGRPDTRPAAAQLLVYTKTGTIDRNRRRDRTFRIADKQYEHGLAMPSPGEILVRLPGPGAAFEAVVGVDSNDLGYYSNAGRGSVVASVEVVGRETFRSAVLHEGVPGVPAKVDLGGATEFSLKLTAVGERPRTYQAEWDQADWAANGRAPIAKN